MEFCVQHARHSRPPSDATVGKTGRANDGKTSGLPVGCGQTRARPKHRYRTLMYCHKGMVNMVLNKRETMVSARARFQQLHPRGPHRPHPFHLDIYALILTRVRCYFSGCTRFPFYSYPHACPKIVGRRKRAGPRVPNARHSQPSLRLHTFPFTLLLSVLAFLTVARHFYTTYEHCKYI